MSRVPKFMDPGSLDNPFIRNLLFFDISVTNSLRLMHWKNFTRVLFLQHKCDFNFKLPVDFISGGVHGTQTD